MFQICHLQGLCSNLRVYWQASSGQNLNEKINPDNCTNVTGNVQCLCTVSRPRDHHHSDTIVTLPRHSAHTVPTPPPRCSDPLSHHPHAAPLQPPCRLHAAAHCPHAFPPFPPPHLHLIRPVATPPSQPPSPRCTPHSRRPQATSTQHVSRPVLPQPKMGGIGKNTHELEKNAKVLEKKKSGGRWQ